MGKTAQYKPVDPTALDLFTVSLEHLSSTPLSHDNEYHLLFISAGMYKKVWSGTESAQAPALSKICVQRAFTKQASVSETKALLFKSQPRNYVVAEYPLSDGLDHCVPMEYRAKLLSNFRAFIVRSNKNAKPLPQFLIEHSTRICTNYGIEDVLDGEMQVFGYRKQPTNIRIQGEKKQGILSRITERVTTKLSIS